MEGRATPWGIEYLQHTAEDVKDSNQRGATMK